MSSTICHLLFEFFCYMHFRRVYHMSWIALFMTHELPPELPNGNSGSAPLAFPKSNLLFFYSSTQCSQVYCICTWSIMISNHCSSNACRRVVLFRKHIWLSRRYLATCLACTGPWYLALGSTNELTDSCVIPATMKSPTVGDFSAGPMWPRVTQLC